MFDSASSCRETTLSGSALGTRQRDNVEELALAREMWCTEGAGKLPSEKQSILGHVPKKVETLGAGAVPSWSRQPDPTVTPGAHVGARR